MNRNLFILCVMLLAMPLLWCQTGVTTGGVSVMTSAGSLSFSIGQIGTLHTAIGNYYDGLGVQQPYCDSYRDTIRDEVCQYQEYHANNMDLPSDSTEEVGEYRYLYHLSSVEGCDSFVTLILLVHSSPMTPVDTMVVCDSLDYSGKLITSDSLFVETFSTPFGCDSVKRMQLIVNHTAIYDTMAHERREFVWYDSTYIQDGVYSRRLSRLAANGCDSIVNLHLTLVQNLPPPVIYCFDGRLLLVDHFPYGQDSTYIEYPAYRWYCNDVMLSDATADGYYRIQGRRYLPLTGCFYVEADAGGGYWMRSNQICLGSAKTVSDPMPEMTLSPNPVTEGAMVAITMKNISQECSLKMYDMWGRMMWDIPIAIGTTDAVLMAPQIAGVYTLRLTAGGADDVVQRLVVR